MSHSLSPASVPSVTERLAIRAKRFTKRARFHLGMAILGRDAKGAWAVLWIIRERALDAVTSDGQVILANCEALAEALHRQMPGTWTFTMKRNVEDETPSLDHPHEKLGDER